MFVFIERIASHCCHSPLCVCRACASVHILRLSNLRCTSFYSPLCLFYPNLPDCTYFIGRRTKNTERHSFDWSIKTSSSCLQRCASQQLRILLSDTISSRQIYLTPPRRDLHANHPRRSASRNSRCHLSDFGFLVHIGVFNIIYYCLMRIIIVTMWE